VKSPNLVITESNAPAVCAWGVALGWLVLGVPGLMDWVYNFGGKRGTSALCLLLWGFIGSAFYLCLAGPVVKGLWKRFPPRPWSTVALVIWIALPLGPMGLAIFFIVSKIAGN